MTRPNFPFVTVQDIRQGMHFSSAEAKYQALVAATQQEPLSVIVSRYIDTRELTKIEREVFGIGFSDVPALYWAYERYENLIGVMSEYFGEFTDQERIDHEQFYRGKKLEWSFDLAFGFMMSVCNLPAPKCRGWLCKIVAANTRVGLFDP